MEHRLNGLAQGVPTGLRPNVPSSEAGVFGLLSLTPFLDQSEPEFSASFAHGGLVADERFTSAASVS